MMDLKMEYLGMDTMTYNCLLRAGARSILDVCDILNGKRAMQRKIPEYVLRKAKEYVETQESILGVRLLGEE
ncbi:hypothetical protein [Bacteroides sp.]|uniref:hypothetical protein n=1 Tax=Bacteroides sp. TaxID=29523 RepID=UPI0031FC12BC